MNGNIFINAVCICLMGLICFGALGDVAYAVGTSSVVPVAVVAVLDQSVLPS